MEGEGNRIKMKHVYLFLFFQCIFFGVSYADECVYNQDIYKEMYEDLKQKYSNTRYRVKEKALEIDLPESRLVLWYGGCEHHGTEIQYYSKTNEEFNEKSRLFKKVIELVGLFGRHMIETDTLKKIFDSSKYQEIEPNNYFVFYPTMDMFSITNKTNNGKAHISITFYN